ncbi:hypothetical protein P280DRAFT_508599 [Massarina eburnea CBS 473.64]|uniref:Uncharacterized protein n=1 Tax=Massarina eburnea CBS 473.64 TaxID=1395130 RepID=A0A6A6RXD8_9PLEO|nr:hypothetical protein P280DRAFT_508599 [Massarina eburnea CBS 473.64]
MASALQQIERALGEHHRLLDHLPYDTVRFIEGDNFVETFWEVGGSLGMVDIFNKELEAVRDIAVEVGTTNKHAKLYGFIDSDSNTIHFHVFNEMGEHVEKFKGSEFQALPAFKYVNIGAELKAVTLYYFAQKLDMMNILPIYRMRKRVEALISVCLKIKSNRVDEQIDHRIPRLVDPQLEPHQESTEQGTYAKANSFHGSGSSSTTAVDEAPTPANITAAPDLNLGIFRSDAESIVDQYHEPTARGNIPDFITLRAHGLHLIDTAYTIQTQLDNIKNKVRVLEQEWKDLNIQQQSILLEADIVQLKKTLVWVIMSNEEIYELAKYDIENGSPGGLR